MKPWGVFLLGGGLGLLAGAKTGAAAALPGLVIAVVGLSFLVFARAGRSGAGDELVGEAMAPHPAAADGKPSLAGLGKRVDQILSLAKEQADDHLAQARVEADRILAEARAKARRILADAQGEAGRSKPNDAPPE